MISNYLYYQWSLAGLLVWRNIDFRTWRYAAWHRPIAVAGRGGSWIVDARADSYAPFSAARGSPDRGRPGRGARCRDPSSTCSEERS